MGPDLLRCNFEEIVGIVENIMVNMDVELDSNSGIEYDHERDTVYIRFYCGDYIFRIEQNRLSAIFRMLKSSKRST